MTKTFSLHLRNVRALLCAAVLITALAQLAGRVSAQTTCTTCSNPPQLGRQDTWPQNTRVTVNLSPSFTADEVRYIEQAFLDWQNSGSNAGVVYQFTQSSQPAYGTNTIQIWKETPAPDPDGSEPQAVTTPYYNAGNTNLDHAVIEVDPRVTDTTALQMAMAHEIGHTYGLDDCDTCCDGTSVMTGYDDFNDIHSGMVSPSTCDVNTANQAGQYDPNTVNPPSTGGGGGGGDAGGGGGGGYYCTDYYWYYYESTDGGQTWDQVGDPVYAGCW